MMFGPEGTFSEAALAYDTTTLRPMSWVEYSEAIDQPRKWPTILPSIELPVHFVLAEFEAMSETGEEVLREVAACCTDLNQARRSFNRAQAII